MTSYLSKKITHLMFVLTILIVFVHFSASYVSFVQSKFSLCIIDLLGQCIARNAVPLFFAISGFLAFCRKSPESLIVGAKKRLFTLGVPYLIWNTIGLVFFLFLDHISGVNQYQVSFPVILQGVFMHKFLGPYWYILYLLILSLLSPVLYYLFRSRIVAVCCIAILSIMHLCGIMSWGLVYYCIGAVIAMHFDHIVSYPSSKAVVVIALILFIVFAFVRMMFFDPNVDYETARKTLPYLAYELMSPICFWLLSDLVDFQKLVVHEYEKHTFVVYSSHIFLVSIFASTTIMNLVRIPSLSDSWTLFIFLVFPIIIFFVLTSCSLITKKYFPLIFNLLTGGR